LAAVLPLSEVRDLVLARGAPLPTRRVPVGRARGCVLAEDVEAASDLPGFSGSAMDGFAVRSADVAGAGSDLPVVLEVVDSVRAGRASEVTVGPRQAVRIMTGAPVPAGADAVVPVEQTRPSGGTRDHDETVAILSPAAAGQHVRGPADDVAAGTVVVRAGTSVTAPLVGVLTSLGLVEVAVTPRPRVGVLSTGDELVEAPRGLGPGQIRDSNRPMLLAAVAEAGAVPVDLGWVRDSPDSVAAALRAGATRCDVLLTSGGVSMGEADVVKLVLDRMADPRWLQIAIRPAKPFALATVDGVPLLGLPGNPVSALVSFELLARPLLRRMAGESVLDRPTVVAAAGPGLGRRPDGKVHHVRVTFVAGGAGAGVSVVPVAGQGSHQLVATSTAQGLAILPDGDGVAEGGAVDVLVLDESALVAAQVAAAGPAPPSADPSPVGLA
jgi:molybdenum cofactor synthesis domain-containing protein